MLCNISLNNENNQLIHSARAIQAECAKLTGEQLEFTKFKLFEVKSHIKDNHLVSAYGVFKESFLKVKIIEYQKA